MRADLEALASYVESPVHLLIWEKRRGFEVISVKEEEWTDAFPLPLEVQSAAAECGFILDTSTAARLDMAQMPGDFWEGMDEVAFGDHLIVSLLGRSGRKYLEVYRSITSGEMTSGLTLGSDELLLVTRWLKEQEIFDYRKGDDLMKVLSHFGK
ncbi:MAG: hypothetical protein PVJ98_04395 [Akkermansiaceae bacterium]|jgi:hypothetical protein